MSNRVSFQIASWRAPVLLLISVVLALAACGPAAQPSATTKTETKPSAPATTAAAPASSPVAAASPAASPVASPVASLAASPAAASPAAAGADAAGPTLTQPVNLRFASQEVGGGWYVYAVTMSEILRQALPSGSTIDVLPHAAAIGNPRTLAAGQAEIGFVYRTTGSWAYRGIVAYDQPMENLRALVGGLDQYYVGVVARRGLGINSLEDLRDRREALRVYTVPRGGVGELATRQVLESLGLSYDEIQRRGGSVQHVGFNVITSAFLDGRADLLMHTVNQGHPSMTEIATTADVEFLPLPEAAVRELGEIGWDPLQMPANTFPKQDQALQTVGDTTVLAATADLPDDVAYVITKTIVENSEALATANAALQAFRPEDAFRLERTGIPLHPGAERYYRDRGWLR